jgi:hypothetical protein
VDHQVRSVRNRVAAVAGSTDNAIRAFIKGKNNTDCTDYSTDYVDFIRSDPRPAVRRGLPHAGRRSIVLDMIYHESEDAVGIL